MGKSKRRILHQGRNNQITNLTREDALKSVVSACNAKKIDIDTKDLISLFGLSAEELLEEGASYEDVIGLKGLLNNQVL